jgi:hypothetical protein
MVKKVWGMFLTAVLNKFFILAAIKIKDEIPDFYFKKIIKNQLIHEDIRTGRR